MEPMEDENEELSLTLIREDLMPLLHHDFEKAKEFINNNRTEILNARDASQGHNLLHLAIIHNRLDLFIFLLERMPHLVCEKCKRNMTPLMLAACVGRPLQLTMAQAMARKVPAAVNFATIPEEFETIEPSYTALHYLASAKNSGAAMKTLLEQGADIDFCSASGETPLLTAMLAKNLDSVRFLVDNGATVSEETLMEIADNKKWACPDSWAILLYFLVKAPDTITCAFYSDSEKTMDGYSINFSNCLPEECSQTESLVAAAARDGSEQQADHLFDLFKKSIGHKIFGATYFMPRYLDEAIASQKNELALKILGLPSARVLQSHLFEAARAENEFMWKVISAKLGPKKEEENDLHEGGKVISPLRIAIQKRSLKAIKFIKEKTDHFDLNLKVVFCVPDIVTDDPDYKDLLFEDWVKPKWKKQFTGNILTMVLGNRILHQRFDETTFELLEYFVREGVSMDGGGHIPLLCLLTYVHRTLLSQNLPTYHKILNFLLEKGPDPNIDMDKGGLDMAQMYSNAPHVHDFAIMLPTRKIHSFPDFGHLQENFGVPDALLLAFYSANVGAILKLIPFWKAPPAALILAAPEKDNEFLLLMLKYLLPFGLPHGTKTFQLIEKRVQDFDLARKDFVKFTETPCSLQSLAALAVRRSCKFDGKEMIRALESLVPDLMKDVLTFQKCYRPSENPVFVQAERDSAIHQEMVQRFNETGKSLRSDEFSQKTIRVYRYTRMDYFMSNMFLR